MKFQQHYRGCEHGKTQIRHAKPLPGCSRCRQIQWEVRKSEARNGALLQTYERPILGRDCVNSGVAVDDIADPYFIMRFWEDFLFSSYGYGVGDFHMYNDLLSRTQYLISSDLDYSGIISCNTRIIRRPPLCDYETQKRNRWLRIPLNGLDRWNSTSNWQKKKKSEILILLLL